MTCLPPDGGYFCLRGVAPAGFQPASLDVSRGECIAIMGASGAGKSLYLRQIADLDPGQGEIWLDGVARSSVPGPVWRRRVRYCQAESGWWDDAVAAHFPEVATPLLAELGLRPDILAASVHELSTGERQRLSLVRALLDRPQVLLLDEPTAALDETAGARVETLVQRLQSEAMTIIVVTHKPEQARRLATRCYRVQDHAMTRQWARKP
ncbi:ABC transporter ATP-binding protein [Bordetella avium]|uniref:ABC transporter ATP-binding protein n=2 Tax=Bordetella avium TaxID=521 RepID=UPI000E1A7604|nr:ABC transporter ATP-binding protein [Bordetella avium]WQE32249.1 ABC transporter ATP-binding protein [Bordetella avium]SUV69115.1 putrescine ABC transporter ATP-binding protein [Bordetella avium]